MLARTIDNDLTAPAYKLARLELTSLLEFVVHTSNQELMDEACLGKELVVRRHMYILAESNPSTLHPQESLNVDPPEMTSAS